MRLNLDVQDVTSKLKAYKHRLLKEVLPAYEQRGSHYGGERFNSWKSQFRKFISIELPNKSVDLTIKLSPPIISLIGGTETDKERFYREYGEPIVAFIDSLIIDIKNGEYEMKSPNLMDVHAISNINKSDKVNSRVFIVHGHDGELKNEAARFIEKLGFKAIILHEQANQGMTIIEKLEPYTNVGFAIVLYTPDDLGESQNASSEGDLKPRARQNVIFEHGYLIAKLGRSNVVPLVKNKNIELPSDIRDMVYVDDSQWKITIGKELKTAGYPVDLNKL